ncbi:MAG: hypothetical protein E6Z94_00710 [Streptococcus salivarius]|nr:hypothetical protein [Streptococcus gordonii]MBT0906972.1 hypothetical protein [Streptococcus parasanguinis]MBT0926537.1 hypothetical protein [Streptococcus parasanguinis]MDU5765078.1 hypothetical protein [Streptococcus salivarius]
MQIQKQEEVNTMTKEEILTNIAKERIGAETLETRNSDRLDFYDISVWALKEMLEQAYEAGRQAK